MTRSSRQLLERIAFALIVVALSLGPGGIGVQTAPARAFAVPSMQIDTPDSQWVNLTVGDSIAPVSELSALQSVAAQPLSLTAARLNDSAAPQAIVGYSATNGGVLVVYTDLTGNGETRSFPLPEAPDFLAVGDFNADSYQDAIAAARNGTALWFLSGDGAGGLGDAVPRALPGRLTALVVGELYRQDGLADIAVGVNTPEGPRLLTFMSSDGAKSAEPEVHVLSASATGLVIGQLDDDYPYDLALIAGDTLQILSGRDHLLIEPQPIPTLVEHHLDFTPVAIALGDFLIGHGVVPEIALLGQDGWIHLMDRDGVTVGSPIASGVTSGDNCMVLRAKISGLPADDLVVLDAAGRQVHIVAPDGQRMTPEGLVAQAVAPGTLTTLGVDSAPVAVLPVRLNGDGLDDLLLMTAASPTLVLFPTDFAHTFVVNNPGDMSDDNIGDGKCETELLSEAKVCTLRGAIQEANASAGFDDIQLAIERGFWWNDAIDLESALPDITESCLIHDVVAGSKQVIDGRSVPAGVGLHIKTFSVILDDLTFSNFVLADPVIKVSVSGGNTIRNCQIGPSNVGVGIELNTGSNRIWGNVISGNGTGVAITGGDGNWVGPGNLVGFGPAGSGATNSIGVRVSDGATNTHIGDPEPPAGISGGANVISGNRQMGIALEDPTTSGTLILKNMIGLDATGTLPLGNATRGIMIWTGAKANTIGNGTLAGRNLIGANGIGIDIDHGYGGTGDVIRGNFIGVNAAGAVAIANTSQAIHVDAPGAVQILDNTIGGSSTTGDAILLEYSFVAARPHVVRGNGIGVNPAQTVAMGHGGNGVRIVNATGATVSYNTISNNGGAGIVTSGGGHTMIWNTIANNGSHGMSVGGSGSTIQNNTVSYNGPNHVGIQVTGGNTLTDNTITNAIQSGQVGISLLGSSNTVSNADDAMISGGYYGIVIGGSGNTVSGYTISDAYTGVSISGSDNTIGAGNRIHGNMIGIAVDSTANDTTIRGNFLGVDATGNGAAPNYDVSILINGTNTTIGGANAADGNVISGGSSYQADGLRIAGGSDTTVRYNKIGLGADGTTALGNRYGIIIVGGTTSTIQDNTIANNGTGVRIEQGTRHAIIGNSIRSNTALGIDLSPAGVTANDTGDTDSGGNGLQNYPVISLAGIVTGGTRVQGVLDSAPSRTYTLRVYASPTCDASGYGEGQTYLGQGTVSTNAGGQANIDLTVGAQATSGTFVAVTATDPDGNTSEFSACAGPVRVLGASILTVNTTTDAVDANTSDGVCATSGGLCSLRAAVQQANATGGGNTILVPAGTYPLTLAGIDTTAAAGDLDVTDVLTISGAGANVTVVDSQVADRVFEIRNSTAVTITGLTAAGGGVATTANGGGITIIGSATLRLDAVSVQQNQTTGGSGGGIYSEGTLILSNSSVISNTAGAETNGGGGVYLWSGTATLRNTTISGNQTNGNGGGMLNLLAAADLNNVTVTGNTADSDADGGDGGGLWNTSVFTASNSIIAGNFDLSDGSYPNGAADCDGAFTSAGYNLIGDQARESNTSTPACQGFDNYDSVGGTWFLSNYLTFYAGLAPLQLNGGTTLNHSPYSSAAGLSVDYGNPATPGSGVGTCEAFDQRGQARPIDGGTDGIAECDRGAVEHIPSFLSIEDATVAEGATATFNVTLSTAAPITFTVQYSTTNVTAISPQDYTHAAGTLTFTPGQVSRSIAVTTLTDTYNEPAETYRVRLFSPQWVMIADGEGIGSITDGSPVPSLQISNRAVTEGDAGSGIQASFTVSLNSPSGKTVTVDYATADGTAVAGEDYTSAQGTLTFAPGVTSQVVAINVLGDNLMEGAEAFSVELSTPVNATIADATGAGTITDDDVPAFSINDASILEGDTGTSPMVFIVELSKPSSQQLSVHYATSAGTAEPAKDYLSTSGALIFAAGEVVRSISVPIVGDVESEPFELFTVSLNTPSAGTTVADGTATGLIKDDGGFEVFLPLVIRH